MEPDENTKFICGVICLVASIFAPGYGGLFLAVLACYLLSGASIRKYLAQAKVAKETKAAEKAEALKRWAERDKSKEKRPYADHFLMSLIDPPNPT